TSQNKISRRLSLIDALPPSSKNRQLPEVLQSLDTRSFVKKDDEWPSKYSKVLLELSSVQDVDFLLDMIGELHNLLLQAYPKKTATLLKYINEVI
ncbi:hypothetical protein HAX54_029450, partial [Datura stramonium]|nr:hypothetical protein [Datura stramonium]